MRMSKNDALGLVSNLRLTVHPSKSCAHGSSNDELGVGANASSRADMIFVTNDSFSELVWSPLKGLSIRCVVGSVAEKNSSFFLGAGLGDMVLSPPHITGTGTDQQNFAEDRISAPPSNEAVDRTASLRSSDRNKRQSGSCDSINTSPRINCVQDDTAVEGATGSDSRVVADRRPENVLPDDADDRLVHAGSVGEKLECVAENDLLPSDNFIPNSIANIRNSLHGGTKQTQLEVCEISKASPIRALASERKGKEKALSDDDVKKGVSSQEDDDSYESVESCNSARRVSAGKKRERSFEELLIDGSKRLKMQVLETPGTSSFNKSNSSFGNWISTMIKGLPRPDEGGGPSLALPSHVNEMKAFGTSSREQDKTCDSMGFKSHFKSIYRPVPKVQDARLLCADNYEEPEGCEKLKLTENSIEANSSRDGPLAIKENTSKSLNQSLPGAAQDSLLHSTGLEGNVACDPLDSKMQASSKSFQLNMDSTATRDVGSSRNLIAGREATNILGKGCSDLPSVEKVVHTSVKKDDHFSGFFMNHFSPKSPQPVRDSQCNIGCFEDRKNVNLQGSSTEEPTNSAFKKLHNYLLDVEASSANPIEAQNIKQRFTSTDTIASVFAKRLDAFKNILRSDLTDKSASSATTCFFCGITGHDLRRCPQVTETEVNELLRNFVAYGGREESPCLCIRCFQLNHWAAACPNAPSRKKNKEEIWHQKGLGRNLSFPDQGLSITTAWASASPGYYKPPGVSTGLYVDLEMKESAAFGMKASSDLRNVNAAKPEEKASQLSGFPYLCGSLATHAFTMPKGIFDAVKSLRLSRNDIVKWMNSIFSTSLDGYYLRLRRKLGEGLGGTQYHVACICGPQEGKSTETSKGPISVIVDGIRCLVETQYISNQDFLEDELKTWWSATLRGDGRIPSEDELRSKVEERRRLGL